MVIHVVSQGETVYSIADFYGVSPQKLIYDNGILNPGRLVVGQTVVIQFPEQVHTVREGDTIYGIAQAYSMTAVDLLRNNPIVSERGLLYPGQTIVIRYAQEKQGELSANGYTYPFINRWTLRQTLPYLTYLSNFTYGFTEQGNLVPIPDTELLEVAHEYGVAPLMVLAAMTPDGHFSNELAGMLFNNAALQERVIARILETVQEKGYAGVDIDFEYILRTDKDAFAAFVSALHAALSPHGYIVSVALAPKVSADQPGVLYEGHDYASIGAAADLILLMTYEWGYAYGPPMAVAPIGSVRHVLDYAITEIPPEKLLLGFPNYGYDWQIPYVQGQTRAQSIGNVQAVDLAARMGAVIEYDEASQAPFFHYRDGEGREHVVWFEDARSVRARLALIPEYGLYGTSIWHIRRYFPQLYLVMNALYEIRRVDDNRPLLI